MITLLLSIFLLFNCSEEKVEKVEEPIEKEEPNGKEEEDDSVSPPPDHSKLTLKDTKGWKIDTLDAGASLIWYNYTGAYTLQKANQIVNVLELDLSNSDYELDFAYMRRGSTLSNAAVNRDAVAGINACYEMDASFIKTNGNIISEVTLDKNHLRFWKHEGAFFYGPNKASIEYGTNTSYKFNATPNIYSAAPMLIDNYKLVGENFIGDVSGINLNSLEYEDYRRHQGVRHPRTAVALMPDNKVLLITVDGRHKNQAEGMSAAELTQFIGNYFNPKSALNLDGGGSTSMWIKNSGVSSNNIVNYPTDNNKFDHYGERHLSTFILIREVKERHSFAGGNGTKSNPYIIKTASHMDNIHDLDWSAAANNPIYFKMEADVDMSGIEWEPINHLDPYSRHLHFDGNGHIIENLTSKGYWYSSLFGVLIGSCKNLGVVNANIETSGGGGIIGGYVGLIAGGVLGTISNCYTSGIVKAGTASGGIVGNIGKPMGTVPCGIYNSYSTATVIGDTRVGGVVGVVWGGGVLENVYSSGEVSAVNSDVGGVAGYSDSALKGCVALNTKIKTDNSNANHTIGRLAGVLGERWEDQQTDCWALKDMIIDDAGTNKPDSDLVTEPTSSHLVYDGVTKTAEFLKNIQNYATIGWKTSGDTQVWSSTTNQKGYPILLWQYERGDFNAKSGH